MSLALAARATHIIFMGFENMWVNFGRTQCHLPSRAVPPRTEVLRGTVGLVVPSLAELRKRLEYAGSEMKRVVPEAKTKFSWKEKDGAVEATCPWGNRVRCHAPSPEFGNTELGIVYVDFDVPQGHGGGHRALLQGSDESSRIGAERASYGQRRAQPAPVLHRDDASRCRSTTTITSRSTSPTSARRTTG